MNQAQRTPARTRTDLETPTYAQALALADECWITDIDAAFPGDTHAPIPGPDWHAQLEHPEASGWRQSISAPVRYRYRVLTRHWGLG